MPRPMVRILSKLMFENVGFENISMFTGKLLILAKEVFEIIGLAEPVIENAAELDCSITQLSMLKVLVLFKRIKPSKVV